MRRAEDVLNSVSETVAFRQTREGHAWINELETQTEKLRALVEFQNRNLNTVCTFHHCYRQVHLL